MKKDKIVIIGIGNPIMGDDGVGVAVARKLSEMLPEIDVIEGSVYCADLLPFLERRTMAIFIDGIEAGEKAGSIFRFNPREIALENNKTPLSLHEFGVSELLAAASLTDSCPENVVVYGIQVKNIGVGMELSEEVERAVKKVCDLVVDEVKNYVESSESQN